MTIDLDEEQLRTHARHVGNAETELSTIAAAADSVDLDGKAFGVMCAFLPDALRTFTPTQAGAIRAAAGTARRTERALENAVDDVVHSDAYDARRLNALGERLRDQA